MGVGMVMVLIPSNTTTMTSIARCRGQFLSSFTFIKEEQSHLGGDFVMIGIGFLLAKVAVNTGIQLENVLKAGPALILH